MWRSKEITPDSVSQLLDRVSAMKPADLRQETDGFVLRRTSSGGNAVKTSNIDAAIALIRRAPGFDRMEWKSEIFAPARKFTPKSELREGAQFQSSVRSEIRSGTIRKVLAQFGFGNVKAVSLLPNAQGSFAEPHLIETGDGEKLVISKTGWRRRPEPVIWEASLREGLRNSGLSEISEMLKTKKGDPFVEIDEHYYVLSEFKPGSRVEWGEIQGRKFLEAAKLQAKFHNASAKISPHGENLSVSEYNYPLADLLNQQAMIRFFTRARDSIASDPFKRQNEAYRFYLGIFDFILSQIRTLDQNSASHVYESLPKTIIHGDFNARNLLFDGGQISGLIDFDFSRKAPRIQDLANGSISIDWTEAEPVDFTSLTQFLKAYQAEAETKLTPEEIRALPDAFRAWFLEGMAHGVLELQKESWSDLQKIEWFQKQRQNLNALDRSLKRGDWEPVYRSLQSSRSEARSDENPAASIESEYYWGAHTTDITNLPSIIEYGLFAIRERRTMFLLTGPDQKIWTPSGFKRTSFPFNRLGESVSAVLKTGTTKEGAPGWIRIMTNPLAGAGGYSSELVKSLSPESRRRRDSMANRYTLPFLNPLGTWAMSWPLDLRNWMTPISTSSSTRKRNLGGLDKRNELFFLNHTKAGVVNGGLHGFPAEGRESLQNVVNRESGLEILQSGRDGDSSAAEDGSSPANLRMDGNVTLPTFEISHDTSKLNTTPILGQESASGSWIWPVGNRMIKGNKVSRVGLEDRPRYRSESRDRSWQGEDSKSETRRQESRSEVRGENEAGTVTLTDEAKVEAEALLQFLAGKPEGIANAIRRVQNLKTTKAEQSAALAELKRFVESAREKTKELERINEKAKRAYDKTGSTGAGRALGAFRGTVIQELRLLGEAEEDKVIAGFILKLLAQIESSMTARDHARAEVREDVESDGRKVKGGRQKAEGERKTIQVGGSRLEVGSISEELLSEHFDPKKIFDALRSLKDSGLSPEEIASRVERAVLNRLQEAKERQNEFVDALVSLGQNTTEESILNVLNDFGLPLMNSAETLQAMSEILIERTASPNVGARHAVPLRAGTRSPVEEFPGIEPLTPAHLERTANLAQSLLALNEETIIHFDLADFPLTPASPTGGERESAEKRIHELLTQASKLIAKTPHLILRIQIPNASGFVNIRKNRNDPFTILAFGDQMIVASGALNSSQLLSLFEKPAGLTLTGTRQPVSSGEVFRMDHYADGSPVSFKGRDSQNLLSQFFFAALIALTQKTHEAIAKGEDGAFYAQSREALASLDLLIGILTEKGTAQKQFAQAV